MADDLRYLIIFSAPNHLRHDGFGQTFVTLLDQADEVGGRRRAIRRQFELGSVAQRLKGHAPSIQIKAAKVQNKPNPLKSLVTSQFPSFVLALLFWWRLCQDCFSRAPGVLFGPKEPNKALPAHPIEEFNVAKEDAALKDVSKTELAEAYSKLKSRTKNAQVQAKKEGEMLIEDVLTIAAGGGLGYMMGQRHAEAEEAALAEGLSGDDLAAAIAEGGQVAGIDLDLLIGGGAAAAGLLKLGGKMSNTVRKIGIGGLTAYAARIGMEKGKDSVQAEE